MRSFELATRIDAPPETVFDLARSVDAHEQSMADTGERAVAGKTTGLLGAGDRVTWRARHFGVPLTLTAEITEYDRPRFFRDEQVDGPFAAWVHDHRFDPDGDATVMTDSVRFASPLGPLGRLVDAIVLEDYLERLIRERGRTRKRLAENA